MKINKKNLFKIIMFIMILFFSILLGNRLFKIYKIEKTNSKNLVYFFDTTKEQEIEYSEQKDKNISEMYIGVLKIEKVNLNRGFYDKKSKLNKVSKNIQVLDESDMPDIEFGNVILAAHSGNSSVSFFKNLSKLKINDYASIYYKNKEYKYSLKRIYEIEKNGTAIIKRDINKNTLTLITCKSKTKKQIVFIFELEKIE